MVLVIRQRSGEVHPPLACRNRNPHSISARGREQRQRSPLLWTGIRCQEYEEGCWLYRGALVWLQLRKRYSMVSRTSNRSQDRGGFGPSPSQGTATAEVSLAKQGFTWQIIEVFGSNVKKKTTLFVPPRSHDKLVEKICCMSALGMLFSLLYRREWSRKNSLPPPDRLLTALRDSLSREV